MYFIKTNFQTNHNFLFGKHALLPGQGGLVLLDQLDDVPDVLVRLIEQVGQPLVLLLVDQLPVPLLVFRL